MIVMVFAAFFSAGITGLRTEAAKVFCFGAVEAHELRGSIAECGAFHIKLYTFCHHLYIFFLRAGRGAVITGGGTAETGFDTSGIVIVHIDRLRESFKYRALDPADYAALSIKGWWLPELR